MAASSSPVVRRRRLGLELRELRDAKGLTGEDAAKQLNWSNSKLSRMELGRNPPSQPDLVSLLDLYEITDQERRDELTLLLREAKRKGWWQIYSDVPYSTYIGLEAEADLISTYEPVVPGLFQTEDYTRSIIQGTALGIDDEALHQRVAVRLTRQAILTREQPVEIRAVLDESALRRIIGSPAIMRKQLEQLRKLAERPNIILQVVPFSAGAHPGTMVNSFSILHFDHPADPDVVYAEGNTDPYPDREGDLPRYTKLFDHLRSQAMSVAETEALIREMEKEL